MSDVPIAQPVKALVGVKRRAKFEFELYPNLWERKGLGRSFKKSKWKYVFFNRENRQNIPKGSGIYMFVVAPRHAYLRDHTYIFYVGQADDLNRRYGQYLDEQFGEDLDQDRERIVDFLDYFKGHVYFNYVLFPKNELDKAEDYLVDHIYPWANTIHRKEAKAKLLQAQTL
jgi:hypothetical protein